ncbi:hypothetical protein MKS88_001582 [Plasmodium brasilianum]|uniref:Uncharacterized protein n=1 Tax=Plasmodium brasilianum TaxID=5824 RepID=A0ACB9YDZ9_PLABR|nr:hypothetical protein MKS88_001582 [Plasmodium brasilianum]
MEQKIKLIFFIQISMLILLDLIEHPYSDLVWTLIDIKKNYYYLIYKSYFLHYSMSYYRGGGMVFSLLVRINYSAIKEKIYEK